MRKLAPFQDLAIDKPAEPLVGRHRQVDDPPAWNNSTMVVQIIRNALVDVALSMQPEQSCIDGPAPVLAHRPLDLGSGLWR